MPDHLKLKVGDRIRLLGVPRGDLEQRERELREGVEDAGYRANTIERIIARDPIVTISEIDEYGLPWFRYELRGAGGEVEHHSLAIMEDESWCVEAVPLLARLWDYGWLGADRVELAGGSSDGEVIRRYVNSPAFRMSFLPSGGEETGIHGPFLAERLGAEDFVRLLEEDVEGYLLSLRLASDPAEDVEARGTILFHLRGAFEGGRRCYVLRRDERDKELFHEWGFVLSIFREFLFVGAEGGGVERFVVGYD